MTTDKLNWQPTKAEYWKNLPSPARPWPSEVEWFEKYVLEKKEQGLIDVLVLGSTVEFRSMLHKNKMNVHVVDFSKEFYKILSKQPMKHKGEEVFYEENWLAMDLKKKFDLIFGDWVPGVLHTKDYDMFFKIIIIHLKDDGLFIGRECLRPTQEPVSFEKVLKDHYQKYANKYSLYESSMQYIYGYRPDPQTSMWNIKLAQEGVDQAFKQGLFKNKDDYQFISKALAIEKDGSASIMVKEDFENWIKKYLEILAEHHVDEPSSNWYPIYVLKKR